MRAVIVPFENGSINVSAGDAVVGDTSGATGEIIDVVIDSGAAEDGTLAGYLVVAALDAVFSMGEGLVVSPQGFNDGFSEGFQ
jgi:hypothetical protein